jgi:hypothetical protein
MEGELKQPPLGITPQWYWVEKRVKNLKNVIHRFKEAGTPIPQSWHQELKDHKQYLDSKPWRNSTTTHSDQSVKS